MFPEESAIILAVRSMPPHSMYGLGLQEWHVPTFYFIFFSQKGLDELMVMHRHVASKLDTQILLIEKDVSDAS